MTTLILLALLATAGADTTGYVVPDTTSLLRHTKPFIGESVIVPTDSLCATCGKRCVEQVVPCGSYGGIQTLAICYATLCPDHGRHVEWLGSMLYVEKLKRNAPVRWWTKSRYTSAETDTFNNIVATDSVEIGIREDGTCVWRKRQEAR